MFTHEVMKRLTQKGHDLTLFSAGFKGGIDREDVDGVKIIRKGGRYSVYWRAKDYFRARREEFDIIVDEINTRPFLTPTFVKNKPIVALIHQLAREFWYYETPFPLSYIGYYYLEKKWLSYYKDVPTITISDSSRDDLEKLGFKKILMVPEGLSVKPLPGLPLKEPFPTLVFIGRLKRAKLPHHAIQAFSIIKEKIPDARLWIIGDGYMKKELHRFSSADVTFYGFVDSETKYDLLKKAHMLLMPAVREGWGLVVTEANAMGTPAAAYDVSGVRDSIQHGITGILTKNSPESLASEVTTVLRDEQTLARLSHNALQYSRQFNWDVTAEKFEQILNSVAST